MLPPHLLAQRRSSRPLATRISSLRDTGFTAALAAAIGVCSWAVPARAQLTLGGTSYTETFDGVASGLPTGWTVRTGATATSLGSVASFTNAATEWSNSTGAFRNFAAADAIDPNTSAQVLGTETTTVQSTLADRAIGIRQSGGFGDPGAAFTLQIGNTFDLSNFSLSFKAQMLSVQGRSTTWTIQYGLGATPTTFTTLGTYVDPAPSGSTSGTFFGSSPIAFDSTALSAISGQSGNIWIRIAALTTSAAGTTGQLRDTFGIDDFTLSYTRAVVPQDYWDTNSVTLGIGGAGTWDAATLRWNPIADGTGTPAAYNPDHLAVFGSISGTVMVSGTVSTNRGLQFDSDGYVLTGGTITLAGTLPSISVPTASHSATIESVIGGLVGLIKNGLGTLLLRGTNTYSGGTTINEGTISILTDANLGDAAGGLTLLGGKLVIPSSLTLGSTRAVTGTGTIDVAPSATLQIAGAVNGLNLTLSNSGSVQFTGTTPTLAGLTFLQFATVTTSGGPLGIVGNLVSQQTTNTVTFTNGVDFGNVTSAIRQIVVADGPNAVDLLFSGNITMAGANSRIAKTGSGTLEIAGLANSLVGGIRLGEAGVVPIDGGTIRIQSPTALGGGIFQANAGTLVVLTNMTGTNAPAIGVGISVGASESTPVTITGSDIEFPGASSIFVNGSTSYQNKLIVNNNVVLSGSLSGTTLSTGLTVAGPGSLTVAATTNTFSNALTVDQATLVLKGTFTGTTKPAITLQNNATLRGLGTLGNLTVMSGTVAPGDPSGQPTGTFTANDVDLRSTARLALDISSPLQSDQLVGTSSLLIDSTVLTGSILSGANIAIGDLFFIAINGGTGSTLGTFLGLPDNSATPARTTFSGPGGTVTFEIGYHGDSVSGIFDATGVGGNDVVLRALVAVPEPGSAVFLASGFAGLLGLRRMRRVGR